MIELSSYQHCSHHLW